MNFGRILANAVARRIAVVIVAAALAWLGLSDARAQSYSACTSMEQATAALCPSVSAALSGMQGSMDMQCVGKFSCTVTQAGTCTAISRPETSHDCILRYNYKTNSNSAQTAATISRRVAKTPCAPGLILNPLNNQCQEPCSSRSSQVFAHADRIPGGSHGCSGGCQFAVAGNGDGTYTRTFGSDVNTCNVLPECLAGEYLHVGTSLCMAPEPECTSGQVKNAATGACEQKCPAGMTPDAEGLCKPSENECPAGNVRAPSGECLPGDGQCAAGEARRKDGTCGRDSNNDGVADSDDEDDTNDDQKESFSGGDSCSSPPSCSGGPIMCGQARIQWRIDCNTRRNVNITGGSCTTMPVCTGEKCSAMEYASLLQQWRATCALEKLASRDGGEGEGGQPEWTKVTGDGTGGAGEDPEKPHRTVALGLGMLDAGGFLGFGSCPSFGSVDLGIFGSVNLDDYDWICKFLAAVKIVMVGMGGFIAFGIVAGRVF